MSYFDPVPCIVCGTQLETVFDPSQNQPHKGTVFMTNGHYGSTFFDPMDGSSLEIVVCDECCKKAVEQKRMVYRNGRYDYQLYNGEHP